MINFLNKCDKLKNVFHSQLNKKFLKNLCRARIKYNNLKRLNNRNNLLN